MKNIFNKIDSLFIKQQEQICHHEAQRLYGERYEKLTIERCDFEEFKNKISSDPYYYEVAQYIWDAKDAFFCP